MLIRQFNNILNFIRIKKSYRVKVAPDNLLFPVIWITRRCNLHCAICDQWKTGDGQELSKEKWFSFIDSAARLKARVIVITGGEPLLREDIFEIIAYIRQKKIGCHLCSNGSLLNNDGVIDRLKKSGLNSISVSLDSPVAELYKNIRGDDCFDEVVSGIRLLKKNSPEIKVGINCVITRLNFINLERMIYFAESLKVDQIKFDIVHTNLMHRNKPLTSFSGLLFTPQDLPQLKEEIRKLIAAAAKSRLLTNSRTFLNGIFSFCQKEQVQFDCYAGYVSCAIDASGRVAPCDNFDGVGSLNNQSFEEIWRSAALAQLRQKVHHCRQHCWDSTHGEINIRCSIRGLLKEIPQVIREQFFYL